MVIDLLIVTQKSFLLSDYKIIREDAIEKNKSNKKAATLIAYLE
ncbi:7781_t:CDS:1, partial [Funneliformis mosseae]